MNISFKQLRLWRALADTGSVGAAAAATHVTQPTASMQLKEITQAVGVPLYEVVSRRVHLTEAGEELRQQLMGPQMNRIRRAVAQPEGNAARLYRKVLYHMVSPANRDAVRDWIEKANPDAKGTERRG